MSRRNPEGERPQLPVKTAEQLKAGFRKPESDARGDVQVTSSESDVVGLTKSEQVAAELIDEAFVLSRLRNQEAAHLCGVSENLVQKWRSTTSPGCPNFVQMLLLPPAFHYALHKAMNRKYGYGRMALRDALEALGSLAMVIE